jgi:hypothetical protein
LSWCAGRNPPFVYVTAFSFTGYPRLLQKSSTPIRPFTLQDSRFTAANRIINDKESHHPQITAGRTVSAQEPRLSPRALAGAAVQHGGRSFLRPKSGAVRQLTNPKTLHNIAKIKIIPKTQQYSNAYIFPLLCKVVGDQNMIQ